jgi:phenylalanyl-tRNA synthetase beta chain
MQFSENWLRTLVRVSLDSGQLAHILTMSGLEVEESVAAGVPFTGVVIAHVLSVEKHPDADKLKLCRVDVGGPEPLQIVCGAPNVAAGLKVPCAQVGAELPGISIKKAKVRGIESFGMLCSSRELGLSEEHGGLLVLPDDAPVGQSIRDYRDLDDQCITLKLTPNRADCLSLTGIARETSALTGASLDLPRIEPVQASHDRQRAIVLDAPAACPRYCGRVVSDVNAAAASPEWMKRRLERSGIRSISALVDVTNYVMLELGQPLHAFDNAHLSGAIHVRYPTPGEQLRLLNEQTVTPAANVALIADEHNGGRALAMAGIMGGEESGITLETTELFLESAFFAPAAIAGKARELGFSSDASFRYERGVDFELQRPAIERATRLILDICGGRPGPIVEAVSPQHLPQRHPVRLRSARAARVLGIDLGVERIAQLFADLGFAHRREGDDFVVVPPSFRFDIEIEEDLIEELARLHGYDNIPAPAPRAAAAMLPQSEAQRTAFQMRRLMVGRDYREVVNFSFVDAGWETDFCANAAPIVLANPIASQMGVMRSRLIGGLVGTLAFNLKRRAGRVRVFEIGRCFMHDSSDAALVDGYLQPLRLGALCAGPALPEQWGSPTRNVDFFDVKADVEALLAPRRLSFAKAEHPALHPGRAATISCDGVSIGVIGELHPRWAQKYELGTAPIVFEVDLAALLSRSLPRYRSVSRFPAVVRDIALVVDQKLSVQTLTDVLVEAAPAIVQAIQLFDVYHGKGLDPNQKSLAYRIVMQDTQKTLEDVEVEAAVDLLVDAAFRVLGAALRA